MARYPSASPPAVSPEAALLLWDEAAGESAGAEESAGASGREASPSETALSLPEEDGALLSGVCETVSFMISLSDIPIENAAFADVLVIAHCSEISAFRG